MANPELVAMLAKHGVETWNSWRELNPQTDIDLSGANLSRAQLHEANLRGANLQEADLSHADLIDANLREACLIEASLEWAKLYRVNLRDANLSKANLARAHLVDANMSGACMNYADIREANLSRAFLRQAEICNAKLYDADLRVTDLAEAKLETTNLSRSNLHQARLNDANLRGANLARANLRDANLRRADLSGASMVSAAMDRADLREANLSDAKLFKVGLTGVDLSRANLTGADLRAATLLDAKLNEATLSGVKLWETQRAGWKVGGVRCDLVFWDKACENPTIYSPGEFERLHSDQSCIELFYHGGVSRFELDTLPALLHHLSTQHPDSFVRLKSIEETGGGAKISISVGDSDPEAVEKVRSDAMQVHRAQLALRENEILRLETEKKYLESFVSERLIKAMLTATTPQNVFNAPVYGAAFPSGNAKVDLHQTVNDNAALIALLETMIEHRNLLALDQADGDVFEAEAQSAKAELQRSEPSVSALSRSLTFVQKLAGEALTKAAGKLGEHAVSADWSSWLHQLNHFVSHLK